jgi:hypothetical protein
VKKALAILLLFVMSINLGGLYLVFRFQQQLVRKEIKRKIKAGVPDQELFFIRINQQNQQELEWIHAREFRYKGRMYDVIRKKVLDPNTIEYACINDIQESRLFAHLDQEVSRNLSNNATPSPQAKVLLKMLSIPYILPQSSFSMERNYRLFSFHKPQFHLPEVSTDILTPPPQLA